MLKEILLQNLVRRPMKLFKALAGASRKKRAREAAGIRLSFTVEERF